jgi:adenylate cyclase
MSRFTEEALLVAFADLTRYAVQIERLDDLEVAAVMADYYELAGRLVRAAGGRIVKFMGDAVIAVFPSAKADEGVLALLDLKTAVDRFMDQQGWECRLTVSAHHGTVAAGLFGAGADERYDVLGKAVNVAARLESTGVALSVEAFRQLSPATRQQFKKHTPPITYIRLEDSHRSPRRR